MFVFSFDYSSAQSVAQSACKYETQNNNDNKEYLKFLYDYMPLSDRADYDTSFFEARKNRNSSAPRLLDGGNKFRGKSFRHLFLFGRANNENLDTARMVMFNALRERFAKMEKETQATLHV